MQQRAPTNKPNPQQPQDTIAAPALYKEIRASLTPSEFEDFASNVAAFNAGDQTAEQTVKNIGGIVRNKRLYACMTSLIYTALDESVTSNSKGKPAVAVDDSVPAGRRSDAA
ncbi:hypothetical protein PhCBS80983_g03240 [Powellomyces hirtus]|uniref:At4g15545-like C-terminal domain-containing protein n=1 Tax=Powellomyces hirtus TaxID=109895 RepID=A0A507E2G1_9FUNG|nr:hypothetical protein PhCBS80983_g03240 [Powellomyces hirtus]